MEIVHRKSVKAIFWKFGIDITFNSESFILLARAESMNPNLGPYKTSFFLGSA